MWSNRLRDRIDAGEVAYGLVTGWPSEDIAEAAGLLGFDFVFIDAEHGALDVRTVADLVRAADCGGATAIVRVPYADPRGFYNYLDAGADGFIFPHVRNAGEARTVVNASLFPPAGMRGALTTSRAARYATAYSTPADYYKAANAATLVLPMIEDVEAVDAVDEILTVPGVSGIFVGPGDMGLSRVAGGRTDAPPLESLLDRAYARGVAAKKLVATVAGTPAAARAVAEKGVRMIGVGVVGLLSGAARDFLKAAPRKM
jgi:2-keto-3-deoxy-L-rhamnonate aldolase RhmA